MPALDLSKATEWPYPVNYSEEDEVDADILTLMAGSRGFEPLTSCV